MPASFLSSRFLQLATLCLIPVGLLASCNSSSSSGTSASAAAGESEPTTFADWNQQHPGAHRKITVADLPAPAPSEAVDNTPHLIPRPADA